MSEGITYDPQGTVTVTFDGNTYRLRRPTFGQFRYFNRKYYGIVDQIQAQLTEAQDLLKKSREAEDPEGVERAKAMLRELGEHPLHEITTPVLVEMFNQVGDPLPEDIDDWPAWLVTDPSIMRSVLDHWRTTPKVSGPAKEANGNG